MKRSVIVSLAAVVAGAGIALAQTGRSGSVFVTETPTPPPSVIRVDSAPPAKAPRPAPPKPKPPTPPVRQAAFMQEPTPLPLPPQTTPVEIPKEPAPTIKTEVLPAPTPVTSSPESSFGLVDHEGPGPSYSTELLGPAFPWTKCGRRACGTVYIETPYFWIDARYLFGWVKQDRSPPLVTSGPVGAAFPGALDDPQTTVLYNGERLSDQPYMGGYFTFGGWLDECQYLGAEAGYFFLASQDTGFIASANGFPGTPGLYLPFFNPLTGAEDVFVASSTPNMQSPIAGNVRVTSRSRFQGADGHLLFSFSRGMTFRCDAIVGVRWVGLDEDLTIEENVKFSATPNALPSDVGIFDRFGTRTDFIGADLGFKTHFERNCWSYDLLTRVAVGGNHQIIRGEGYTSVTFPFFPLQVTPNGRFIGPANNGVFGNDVFSVVPEVGLSVGYQAARWCKITLGYNWLYWTNVVRPGAQVDRVINPIGVPTRQEYQSGIYEPQRPGVAFNQTDIWIQTITLGMQFTF